METAVSNKKNILKPIISWILLSAMATVFLISGISKLIDLETFKWIFLDIGISNYAIATFFAYFFVIAEIWLAVLLLINFRLRQFTIPVSIALLVFLSAYLVYLLATQGDKGNCGCFGAGIYMTPLPALLKNIGMIVALLIIAAIHKPLQSRNLKYIALVSLILCAVLPTVVASVQQTQIKELDLSPLYNPDSKNRIPETDLRQGKHVIAFMSLTCPHCRDAAKHFEEIYVKDTTLPIYFVLNGDSTNFNDFFSDTKSQNIPFILFNGPEEFIKMAGPYVPAIYWTDNGRIVRKVSHADISYNAIKNWVNAASE